MGCAVAMQQAIDRHNRRSEQTRLGVRIGISLGDVTAEDSDYYGLPVVEAARLCALAKGGQILCTDVVRFLAGGRGDYTFQPLGPLKLKGLPKPVPASAVAWIRRAEPCRSRRACTASPRSHWWDERPSEPQSTPPGRPPPPARSTSHSSRESRASARRGW